MPSETVQLIFQIKAENQAILNSLRQAMSGLTGETDKQAKAADGAAAANKNLSITLKLVTEAENGATGARQKSTESMTVAVVKGALYSEILNKIVSAVKEATVESALYAARTQQLGVIMDQLSRTNGLNVAAVRAQADAVRNLGITTQEARATINQMIFGQLDLAKATDLARLAQNAAKIAGISSSEALQGIVNGIKTQQIEVLRTYGIQVSFEQAFIRGAAALGKSKETLTDYERANIALNEVLSKGPRILGTYEISLTTAAGQMQSMKRYIDEARNSLGEGFIPILQKVVGILTDSTRSVQENAEAYQELAKHITAVGLAIAAAKLVPGGPAVKGAVGLAVGIGAEVFGSIDNVEQQTAFATEAIKKVESERKDLIKRLNAGQIKDKEDFLKEDERLKQLQIQIEQNLTETLAKEFQKRRENAGKGSFALQFGPRDSILPVTIGRSDANRGLFEGDKDTKLYDNGGTIKLPNGRVITNAQIDAAIQQLQNPVAPDFSKLQVTPNLASSIDALLGQFTERVKQANKTAEGGLSRSKEGLLFGEAKIEQERRDAIAKVAEEFKPFLKSFADARGKLGEVSDPKERKDLEQTLNKLSGQYGSVVGRINQQYDLELAKLRRQNQIDEIQRGRRLDDARDDTQVQARRLQITQARTLERARLADNPSLVGNEKIILETYQDRVKLAKDEYDIAQRRAQNDLDQARRIFELNKDEKALKDAIVVKAIADVKNEAQLTKEKSEAEVDKQVQILDLRRKQRQEIALAYENAYKIAEAERSIVYNRAKDEGDRRVRLIQAQTLPGNEAFSIRLTYNARIKAAQDEFSFTKQEIDARRKAAYEQYQLTKDSKELEKTATELRVRELNAAYKLEKDIADARVEKEVEIAQIRKQQTEELRQSLGSLYDALTAKGGGGFKDFLQGYFNQIKKTLFVNIGEELFRGTTQRLGGLIPGQEKIDPVTGKGTGELTQLGRILRGTPLGIDPAKLAADRQVNAQDRNTRALDRLSGVLTGAPGGTVGAGGTPPFVGGRTGGGIFDTILGGVFGGGTNGGFGGTPPFVNKLIASGSTYGPGGVDLTPDRGLGGALASVGRFLGPKYNDQGKQVFSPGQTALAAAAAIPAIVDGIQRGGLAGTSQAVAGGLGVAASVPGPQQPFIAGAAAVASLISFIAGRKDRYKEWQDNLNNRLSQKFQLPEAINLTEDLAGNSIDYDFRGRLRSYSGQPSTTINLAVSTMDAKSFMDNGAMISEAVRSQFQLGHPLQSTIKESLGIA